VVLTGFWGHWKAEVQENLMVFLNFEKCELIGLD
jgi:hypothetical protein